MLQDSEKKLLELKRDGVVEYDEARKLEWIKSSNHLLSHRCRAGLVVSTHQCNMTAMKKDRATSLWLVDPRPVELLRCSCRHTFRQLASTHQPLHEITNRVFIHCDVTGGVFEQTICTSSRPILLKTMLDDKCFMKLVKKSRRILFCEIMLVLISLSLRLSHRLLCSSALNQPSHMPNNRSRNSISLISLMMA